jgi:hypothetical protein
MILDVHLRGRGRIRLRRRQDLTRLIQRKPDHEEPNVYGLVKWLEEEEGWRTIRLRHLNPNQIGLVLDAHEEALADGTAERFQAEAEQRHAEWKERNPGVEQAEEPAAA